MAPGARQFVGDEERRRKQRDLKRRYRERRKVGPARPGLEELQAPR